MSDYRELVSVLKELLHNRFYPRPSYIRGLLGDGNGNVLVDGRPDYNLVRFNRSSSETFEVFNKEVSQGSDGWPVLIGSFPWQEGLIQVVGTDWAAYSQTGWGDSVASIQAHAPTHEWPAFAPGSDPINVYMRALTPLRTQVVGSGSNSVYVTPYEYDWTGTNVQWPGVPAMDFSAKPPTGSMLYMGVYLNPATNALGVVSGSTTVFTDALEPSIPNWPLGVYPSGYVRLYGGQAGITERDIRPAQRIYNTTLMFTGTSSDGGWPLAHVLTVSATDLDAGYTTIAAAITASSAGDIILLDAGTYTETVTVSKALTIIGLGPKQTIITSATNDTTTVSVTAANVTLTNLKITNTGAGTTTNCIKLSSSASATLIDNCIIEKISGASTNSNGVLIQAGQGHIIQNCYIRSTTGTTRYGVLADTALSTTRIEGGYVQGQTKDVRTNHADAIIVLQHPILENSTPQASLGNIQGHYYDILGNFLPVDFSGTSGGVWLHKPDGFRVQEPSLTQAVTDATTGAEIHLFPGTYDLSTTGLSLATLVHIVGDGDPRSVIITGSGDYTFSVAIAGCTFRNLTIKNTAGGGTDRDVVQWNVNNVVFENCLLVKTGAADDSACFLQYGGTGAQIINCEATTTGATKNYAYWNNTATATCEIRGGKLSGGTWDILGDQASSVLTIVDPVLVNASKSFSGTVQGEAYDQYGRRLRVKPAGINAVRLTLTTGTPVTSSDVTGATTVYAAPYQGSEIEVYNSSFWIEAPFAEISVAVPSTIYRLFDVFVYDNAGTLALEVLSWAQSTAAITAATNATPIVVTSNGHGMSNGDLVRITGVLGNTATNGVWTISAVAANTFTLNGSRGNGAYTSGGIWYRVSEARATGISLQDGRYCKTGTLTRLYLGTVMTGATSGQTSDAEVSGGRFVWNYFNRVRRRATRTSTSSHTNNAAAWQRWNNTDQAIDFLVGVVEDALIININSDANQGTGTTLGAAGVGMNTSTNGNDCFASVVTIGLTSQINVSAPAIPRLGYNFLYNAEFSTGGLTTFVNWNSKVEVLM